MKPTDTSERELENLIVRHLTGIGEHSPAGARAASDARGGYAGGRYVLGRAADLGQLKFDGGRLLRERGDRPASQRQAAQGAVKLHHRLIIIHAH
mgnify:CR=1 FL=1